MEEIVWSKYAEGRGNTTQTPDAGLLLNYNLQSPSDISRPFIIHVHFSVTTIAKLLLKLYM